MKKALLRLLLNDPSEPLRFRVQPEGEDYIVYEIEWNNLVSVFEDCTDWTASRLREKLKG
jgi:hypothetical protein